MWPRTGQREPEALTYAPETLTTGFCAFVQRKKMPA